MPPEQPPYVAHAQGLVFVAPGLNIAARQSQDNSSVVDGIRMVAASLAKATIAEDGKLLLFCPAFALSCCAARQRFEFPGVAQPVQRQRLRKTGLWQFPLPDINNLCYTL